MGWYDKITALEDEVIQLLADAGTDALAAVTSGSIQKGPRALSQYAGLSAFPYIEVYWAEEDFEASTQRAEHDVSLDVAAIVKASKPKDGIDKAKRLFGDCYDVIWANPTLRCRADILPRGSAAVQPALTIGRTQSWVYAVVGTFHYHLRF